MSGEQTMREHLADVDAYMREMDRLMREHARLAQAAYGHAVAALALMDEAVRDYIEGDGKCVLVIDPPRAEA